MIAPETEAPRRNKGFDETHQEMIETAVRLISEKGVEAVSIAALARAMRINRTTVYYHFESREALLAAVKAWSSEQLSLGLTAPASQDQRTEHITRFALENPDLIKLWIDDLMAGGDIRKSYPAWDQLVAGVDRIFKQRVPDEEADAEVYCVLMLTSAFIGPRVFKNSVDPNASLESIVARFRKEQTRMHRHEALID